MWAFATWKFSLVSLPPSAWNAVTGSVSSWQNASHWPDSVQELVTRNRTPTAWASNFKVDKVVANWGRTCVLCQLVRGREPEVVICVCNWCFHLSPSHIGISCVNTNTRGIQTSGSIFLQPWWFADLCVFGNWTGLLMCFLGWFPVLPYFVPLNGHCMIFNGFGCKSPDIWLGYWLFVCQSVCGSPGLVILIVWLNETENRGVISCIVPISAQIKAVICNFFTTSI